MSLAFPTPFSLGSLFYPFPVALGSEGSAPAHVLPTTSGDRAGSASTLLLGVPADLGSGLGWGRAAAPPPQAHIFYQLN